MEVWNIEFKNEEEKEIDFHRLFQYSNIPEVCYGTEGF